MNKQLLSLAMLALVPLLSGCTADDSAGATWEDGMAIYFRTTASDMTRAVTGGTFTEDETFRVFATSESGGTRQVFIPDNGTDNIVSYGLVIPDASYNSVYYGMRGWHTQTPYYWNDEDTYNFYAVHPASAPVITASEGYSVIQLNYTVGDDADTDLLTAKNEHLMQQARGVPLAFGHALAQVTMRLTEQNGVHATVNSIRIENLKYQGDYNFSTGTWTAADNTKTFSSAVGMSLLLLPQTLAENAQVVIEYKILAEDNVTYLRGSATEWATKTIPLTGTWLAGRQYLMTILANYDIRIETAIHDWENGAGDTTSITI